MIIDQFEMKNKITLHLLVIIVVLTSIPLFDGGFDHLIVYWMTLAMLFVLIYDNFKNKKDKIIILSYPFLFYLLFIIWSFISLFWTVNHVRTIVEFIQLLCYGLVYVIVSKLDKGEHLKLGKFVIFTGVAITILALVEYIFVKSSRLAGTFTNPNPFGIFVVMLFLIILGFELEKPKFLSKLIAIIFLSTIILSGSRGSFLSLLIAMPLLLVNTEKKDLLNRLFKVIIFFIIAFLVSKSFMIISTIVQNSLIDRTLAGSFIRIDNFIPSSLTGRLEFWKVAGKLITNKPINGYGLGTYFAAYYLEYGNNLWYARFTHNHYLQIIVELGFVGFTFIAAFFSMTLFNIYKIIKNKDYPFYLTGLFAATIAFFIHIGMDFSWNFPAVTALFFAITAIINNFYSSKNIITIEVKTKYKKLILGTMCLFILWHVAAQNSYLYGLELSNNDKYEESNEIYQIANKFYPVSGIGYALLSDNYYDLYKIKSDSKYLDQAITAAIKSVELLPIDGDKHNKLGNLYLEKGNYIKAEEHLKLGVDYGAYALSRSIDLAKLYLKKEKFYRGEDVLLRALELQPFSLKRANDDNKERVVIETLKIRLLLKKIYNELDVEKLAKNQDEYIVKLIEEYPYLIRYFN